MPLTLRVDGDRWRTHLRTVAEEYRGAAGGGIVPVVKGNGYGFGVASLARRAQWLGAGAGVDTVAAGTYDEVPGLLSRFDGDVLVMSPWRQCWPQPAYDPRVVHTVSRVSDLEELAERRPGTRVVVEALTSMTRHGMTRAELAAAAGVLRSGRLRLEGLALHLPLSGDHEPEAAAWAPGCGLGTERRWPRRRRCSTGTPCAVATGSATASDRFPAPGTCSSSPEGPRTASAWSPRRRVRRGGSAPAPWPAVAWMPRG
jgi:hypothetical protein